MNKTLAIASVISGLVLVSCCENKEDDKKPALAKPGSSVDGVSMVELTPGVAGGTVEETFTVSVKVTAVEASSRKVTLVADDGSKETFTAGPEIKNFDQIKVGDTVSATLLQRLVVFVNSDGSDPSLTRAAALTSAPKGAKPGATLAQSYEVVAKVTAIDTANRTADLKFSDGRTKTVPVRADVDLSRYKVGDNVVIHVTEALSVLVKAP